MREAAVGKEEGCEDGSESGGGRARGARVSILREGPGGRGGGEVGVGRRWTGA